MKAPRGFRVSLWSLSGIWASNHFIFPDHKSMDPAGTGVRFSTLFPGYVKEVGMFARFGMKPPWIGGSWSPSQVARTVAESIEKGTAEKIINSPPFRYSFVLNKISPRLGDLLLLRLSGVIAFQRRKVGK